MKLLNFFKNIFRKKSKIDPELRKSFEISYAKTIDERIRDGFIKTYRPGISGLGYKSFATMKDYKDWCDTLPKWLGYGRTL